MMNVLYKYKTYVIIKNNNKKFQMTYNNKFNKKILR